MGTGGLGGAVVVAVELGGAVFAAAPSLYCAAHVAAVHSFGWGCLPW